MGNHKIIVLSVAKDFTPKPGARYRSDGKFSGEEFYEDYLEPKLSKIWGDPESKLILVLDGTYGYASSFISEICIRLVRKYRDKELIKRKIEFKSDDEPILIKEIYQLIDESELG